MIEQWVIYRKPADYPQGYVVRRWLVDADAMVPDENAEYARNLEGARAKIPQGMTSLPRLAGDDPCIVEVWM